VVVPSKGILKAIVGFHVWLYRTSGGRLGTTIKGSPVCLVTMRGRKSGREITLPLMYTPLGDKVLLVASLGGAPQHPVWYHNLVAHPHVTIQHGAKVRKMSVRQASGEEKAELWPALVASYGDFANYQTKTSRDIPVMICEPE
jgi:deazaflavin-dependent oxidoreductase (nitroreductase family)